MSSRAFGPRRSRLSTAALAALDSGLPVRVETHSRQRSIFSGAEELGVHGLTSELAEMLSCLRIRSFRVRAELEEVTCAMLGNVQCGFWPFARRAALDLAGMLALAANRRLADPELCVRGAKGALRVAELCVKEAACRGVEAEASVSAQLFTEVR